MTLRRRQFFIAFAVLLGAVCVSDIAQAGLVTAESSSAANAADRDRPARHSLSTETLTTAIPAKERVSALSGFSLPTGLEAISAAPAAIDGPVATDPAEQATVVHEIPPPPSSLALGLTALAGMGAYHASRSVRKLHFADLPDWYHAEARRQIGYATAFALEPTDMPLCTYETPDEKLRRLVIFEAEDVVPKPREYLPLQSAARAPPRSSSANI